MNRIFVILVVSLFLLSCENREITVLKNSVRELHFRIDSLSRIVSYIEDIPDADSIKYYIVGSEKALLESGVIERVSGLSREMKINNKFPKKYFLKSHIQLIDTLVVNGKDVKVVGRFNPDTYTIEETGKGDYHLFIIKDKKLFWDDNHYLIVTFK